MEARRRILIFETVTAQPLSFAKAKDGPLKGDRVYPDLMRNSPRPTDHFTSTPSVTSTKCSSRRPADNLRLRPQSPLGI
jgi:hypothetical protein